MVVAGSYFCPAGLGPLLWTARKESMREAESAIATTKWSKDCASGVHRFKTTATKQHATRREYRRGSAENIVVGAGGGKGYTHQVCVFRPFVTALPTSFVVTD